MEILPPPVIVAELHVSPRELMEAPLKAKLNEVGPAAQVADVMEIVVLEITPLHVTLWRAAVTDPPFIENKAPVRLPNTMALLTPLVRDEETMKMDGDAASDEDDSEIVVLLLDNVVDDTRDTTTPLLELPKPIPVPATAVQLEVDAITVTSVADPSN